MSAEPTPLLYGDFSDYIIYDYGAKRPNRNFMPTFVPFPRLERAEQRIQRARRRLRRTIGRFSDAIEAFQHGIPEPDDDW